MRPLLCIMAISYMGTVLKTRVHTNLLNNPDPRRAASGVCGSLGDAVVIMCQTREWTVQRLAATTLVCSLLLPRFLWMLRRLS